MSATNAMSMIGRELPIDDGEALVRVVRALGQHRYVASRLHLVHAFAIDAAARAGSSLADAGAWARSVLDDPSVERGSKDERLFRRVADAELVATLDAFFGGDGARQAAAQATLRAHLETIGIAIDPSETPAPAPAPFDEEREDDMFPLLIDAGWELLPLASLDPERHRGAIAAFGDALAWDVARFDEDAHVPPLVTIYELPAFGAAELLHAVDERGALAQPFVLWLTKDGNETYLDYVLRGVFRAAKIDSREE